jgi:hypothetical protein
MNGVPTAAIPPARMFAGTGALVALASGALLWVFLTRYWYPTDDGLYAHVAERLLAGEVLHRDVQDIHPGYIHIVHALAFRLFGVDLLSLRYPLALAGVLQASLAYVLLQRRSEPLAVIGSLAATALGIVQFGSPTANWYALAITVGLVVWLTTTPSERPGRVAVAGVLLGAVTMFRHLSGVWTAMGVIVLLLVEESRRRPDRQAGIAKCVTAVMLIGVIGYVATNRETEPGGFVLIALWPIVLLSWMAWCVAAGNRATIQLLTTLAAGAAIPAVPIVVYHLANASLDVMVRDIAVAAARETGLEFFGNGWYGVLPFAGAAQAVSAMDPGRIANGWYWAVLPLLWAANGAIVIRGVVRGADLNDLTPGLLAMFYAMVSLYLEGPLYLYYSIGVTLLSLLWMAASGSAARRIVWGATATALSLVALVFHAGQSRHRTPVEILQGARVTAIWDLAESGLDRCTLRLDPSDRAVYRKVVSAIQAETPADGSMLALPNNAELYFLSRRRNVSRFYNAALGVQTPGDLEALQHVLAADPPSIVTFKSDDKYNTPLVLRAMDDIRRSYERFGVIDGIEVYRRRPGAAADGRGAR